MAKYVSLEYVTQNTVNPDGIEYKGVFGNRSIGKTHNVLKYIYKNRKKGEAFMILRRNKLELNLEPFVQKFSSAFEVDWRVEGDKIVEYPMDVMVGRKNKPVGEIVAYFDALSLAERGKHKNYDAPYVTQIIVDEVYAEKPNKNEFHQLETWVTTLSRRTGFPFHPITVWLLGNNEYGISPIMESLGVFPFNGLKQKNRFGVFLFSTMQSPEHVINVKSKYIKEVKIKPKNQPIITWSYKKQSYALYDCGTFCYIKRIEKGERAYDFQVRQIVYNKIVSKAGLPPIFVETYDCLRFAELPGNRDF